MPVTETTLQSGDRLLFYTDGLTERSNSQGQLYGVERLRRQLALNHGDDPKKILDAIMEDAEEFAAGTPADDDQALVLCVVE